MCGKSAAAAFLLLMLKTVFANSQQLANREIGLPELPWLRLEPMIHCHTQSNDVGHIVTSIYSLLH